MVIPGGQTCYEEIKASNRRVTSAHDPGWEKETLFFSVTPLNDSVDPS